MITLGQIKAARTLLNINQQQQEKKAGVSLATLNNIERGAQTNPKLSTMRYLQEALERDGIVFLNDNFNGIGVQLKPQGGKQRHATILIVDDSKADRKLYRGWLGKQDRNYRVVEAENARSGFDAFLNHQPSCVILDFMMYGADGFQLLSALRRENIKLPPIIFVSAMHNEVLAQTAHSQGVFCCLDKNHLTPVMLHTSVTEALSQ